MSKILVIAPHADDEVLGSGGSIIKHVENGDDVYVVIVADRYTGDWQSQREQSKNVKAILGYTELTHLGMEDEKLHESYHQLIHFIESAYLKVKPDIVYTCNGDDINTDHQHVFSASAVACRRVQTHSPSKILCYEIPSSSDQSITNVFAPNSFNTLTEDQVNKKILAFSVYSDEMRQTPNPRSVKNIKTYAEFRGLMCNSLFAESFIVKYERS